jgi:hypothetical protein
VGAVGRGPLYRAAREGLGSVIPQKFSFTADKVADSI